MRIFIDGLIIPNNTDCWILANDWTSRDLICDVLKVVDKTLNADSFYIDGYADHEILIDKVKEDERLLIKRR